MKRLILLVAVAGCNGKPPAPQPVAGGTTAPAAASTAPTAKASPAGPSDAVAAADFLTAVRDRKATVEQFTTAFKKRVAPPELASDQAAGYSDFAARIFVSNLAPLVGTDGVATAPAGPDALIVSTSPGTAPDGPRRTLAKLVRGPNGAWQADWLQVTNVAPALPLTGAAAAVHFPAVAFAGTVLAEQPPQQVLLAADLLTPDARKKLAPPGDPAETALGYSPGRLRIRLSHFRGTSTGATITPATDMGPTATVTGTLTAPGAAARPFTLKLTKGPAEGYLVDEFEAN